jgi:uncharacterized protein DUF5989
MRTGSGLGNIPRALWKRKRWWLIPLVITVLIILVLMVLAAGADVKPYIYPQF